MKSDRVTHAHQTRTQLHAYIKDHPGQKWADIAGNNILIGRSTTRGTIRYLCKLKYVRCEGHGIDSRYYAITESIRPLEEIRERLRHGALGTAKRVKPKPEPESPLPPWVERNVGGSLKSTRQGGQGSLRHEIRRGCSLP